VLGWALTLQRNGEDMDAAQRAELYGRMTSSARKLQRLLDDTIDLDRLSRGILEPITSPTDLRELISGLIDESEFLRGRFVEVDLEPVTASIDRAKVERIVENLLINAVRHTDPDVPIWVRVGAQGTDVSIVVEDAGAGVPEEFREQIFAAFLQGPNVPSYSPGVGIGLSVVARFAALHNGRAWVQDREGGGASFHVVLPGAVISTGSAAGADGDGDEGESAA